MVTVNYPRPQELLINYYGKHVDDMRAWDQLGNVRPLSEVDCADDLDELAYMKIHAPRSYTLRLEHAIHHDLIIVGKVMRMINGVPSVVTPS